MVERLVREARSASSLNHPNICTIHEVDEADGHHFITMELLEGQTLRERIAEGHLPTDEVVRIGIRSPMPSMRRTRKALFIATSSRQTCF